MTSIEHVGTLRNGQDAVRIACELAPQNANSSAWVHVLPLGPDVEARDGRRLRLQDADAVTRSSELPLLVDWDHRSEAADTRAAGWIEELKVEPSSSGSRAGVWGRVRWTPEGREQVRTQHYRFLSPVVLGRRREQVLHVERIASVALTNRPALRLHGIEAFREQLSMHVGHSPAAPRRMPPELRGVDCEKLRRLGLSDELILESATELFGQKLQPDIDRAALRRLGLTDAEIADAKRELFEQVRG